jgi:hypothetical protein
MWMRHVADVVARFSGFRWGGAFRAHLRENRAPVLDELRRVAVDFKPHQRFPKNPALHKRPLRFRVSAEIAQPPLQHE